MTPSNILIIGGGFGGVYTARYLLKKSKNISVTLINPKNYFLFAPMLHEVASGGLNQHTITTPIRDILDHQNFTFIRGRAEHIDAKKESVVVRENGTKQSYRYDYLVFAQGAKANVPSIPGAAQHCLTLKTMDDAALIRNRVINMMERACFVKDKKEQKKMLTFILIGGGPTGVELAGELSQFIYESLCREHEELKKSIISIYLIHRGEKLVSILLHDPSIRKCHAELEKKKVTVLLNNRVIKVGKDNVEIRNRKTGEKQRISSNTIIWTAGITPTVIPGTEPYLDKKGLLQGNEFLQVIGLKNHYALGDCSSSINPGSDKPNPATAQLATRQARVLANNILAAIHGKKQTPFIFKPQGFLVSVGEYFAVAEVFGIWFSGLFAWWMWRTIYLTKLIGWTNRIRVAADWTVNLFFKRDTTQLDGEDHIE